METYQKEFIELALEYQALRFGEFTLKSGRVSPYFFNAGVFNTGEALQTLGECYARAILNTDVSFDVLFGPAYKGIPLACATAIALATLTKTPTPFAFNRKEAKDHGEGGTLIGAPLNQRVLVVDDVITAGTAIRESIDIIKQAKGSLAGIIVALDRQEKGTGNTSAIQDIQTTHHIPVITIIRFQDIIEYVSQTDSFKSFHGPLMDYRNKFGA